MPSSRMVSDRATCTSAPGGMASSASRLASLGLSAIWARKPRAASAAAVRSRRARAADATNLVAVLNGLEDRGLIERRRDRADRRRAIIALSPRGEKLLAGLDRALFGVDDEILASLSRAEREALHAMLLKVASNIAADC